MIPRADAIHRPARWLGRGGWWLACVLLLATTGRLHAQPQAGDPALADALFEEGKTLLSAGDWAAACEKFRRSFELDASVSTQVKIARCSEHGGRFATALGEYERALDLNRTLPQTPARAQELEALIVAAVQELTPRVPKLRLLISPRPIGLEAQLDGGVLAGERLDAPIAVDPGEHQLVVRAPGHREERASAFALEGVTREVRIELTPNAAPTPAQPVLFVPVTPMRDAERTPALSPRLGVQRTAAIVLGGVGVAAIGVGTVFGLQTRATNEDAEAICADNPLDCPEDQIDRHAELVGDAKRARALAIAGFVTGGASLLAGAALWFTADDGPGSGSTALIVSSPPVGSGLQAALRGRF